MRQEAKKTPVGEMVAVPEVRELLPKYYGTGTERKEAIYYCVHCQTPPTVTSGQVAVSISHGHCSLEALLKASNALMKALH